MFIKPSGIAVQGIDPSSGEFVGGFETWGGGSDSYFEYLIKYGRLTNTHDTVFVDTWKTAVDSTIRHLLRVMLFPVAFSTGPNGVTELDRWKPHIHLYL